MTSPMRMVPVEPTREMLDAVAEAFPRSHPSVFPIIWSAMLAASPPPGELREGDVIVRKRHGKWMADVVGDTAHSGGWSDPVSAVRGVRESADAILSAIGAGHGGEGES